MDKVESFLNEFFKELPENEENLKIKKDLFVKMQKRYQELYNKGKTDEESLAIVIAEFGDIKKIIRSYKDKEEMRYDYNAKLETVDYKKAMKFLESRKQKGFLVAIAVFLFILAAASIVFINGLNFVANSESISIIVFLILVAIAVVLLILTNSFNEKYKFIKEPFILSDNIKKEITLQRERFIPAKNTGIAMATALCIVSLILLILPNILSPNNEKVFFIGLTGLLILVGIAVFMFIYISIINTGYKEILQEDEFSITKKISDKSNNKVINIIENIWWPLTLMIYLIWSFAVSNWQHSWIIWVVSAMLFGIFKSIFSELKRK